MPIVKTKPKERFEEYRQMWVGQPKIGKSKTAAQIRGNVFFFTEPGASDMSLDHYAPEGHIGKTYIMNDPADFMQAVHEILEIKPENRPTTITIDTIDGMINGYIRRVCKDHDVKHINEPPLGFGVGWKLLKSDLYEFINELQELNIGLIFITHLEEKTITRLNKEPEVVWRSTLPDQARTMLQSMVDFIWFFTQEGKQRWIYTQGDMSIEAGSRIVLPDRIPMGKSPKKCYQNILTAFYGQNGQKNKAKQELITRILKGEAYLAENKIDSFDTNKRVMNGRKKHLSFEDPELAGLAELQEYLQHLIIKSKDGGSK